MSARKQAYKHILSVVCVLIFVYHYVSELVSVVFEHIAAGRKIAQKSSGGDGDKPKFARLADDGREHDHRAQQLRHHKALPHEIGGKKTVNQRIGKYHIIPVPFLVPYRLKRTTCVRI